MYDSRPDTIKHIDRVRELLGDVVHDLRIRAAEHDKSKLVEPEKPIFDEFTPKLASTTYGSPEYEAHREAMGEGLSHHYAHNRHHPEFHENGIKGMNLLDIIEMLADWKAATERHDDGDLARSIGQNAERFGYGSEMIGLLYRTARDMGWL